MSQEGEILVIHKDDNVDHEYFVDVAKNDLGLIHYTTRLATEEKKIFEDVWVTPDRENAVHYVDDQYMCCQYLWIRGPQTSELVSKTYRVLTTQSVDELIEELSDAQEHDEAVDAILKLGVACPEYDPQVFRAFEASLEHPPSPLFRKATVQAIAYRMWPENRPLLERVVQNDPDEEVRRFAQSILEEYQERAAVGR